MPLAVLVAIPFQRLRRVVPQCEPELGRQTWREETTARGGFRSFVQLVQRCGADRGIVRTDPSRSHTEAGLRFFGEYGLCLRIIAPLPSAPQSDAHRPRMIRPRLAKT